MIDVIDMIPSQDLREQLGAETDDENLRAQLRFCLAEDERLMKRL